MLDDANNRIDSVHAWFLSVAIHTVGIALVMLIGSNLAVDPTPTPFTWNVMIVQQSSSATHENEVSALQTSTPDVPLLVLIVALRDH